jgi:hypothetical protein
MAVPSGALAMRMDRTVPVATGTEIEVTRRWQATKHAHTIRTPVSVWRMHKQTLYLRVLFPEILRRWCALSEVNERLLLELNLRLRCLKRRRRIVRTLSGCLNGRSGMTPGLTFTTFDSYDIFGCRSLE